VSFTLHGAGAGGDIAIGHAHLISSARLEVAHYTIPTRDIELEVMRFSTAVDKVRAELEGLRRTVPADAPSELGAFLNLHLMMLDDATLSHVPRALIRSLRCNAEWALVQQMDYLVGQFEKIEDPYLRERKADVTQVVERLLKAMQEQPGRAGAAPARERLLIVVAHDLSPADMILFKQHQYAGFVTDLGGVTSHTAILARSLGIPAIVGVHSARQMVREGEVVIVDGVHGVLIVDPDPLVLEEYQKRQRELESRRQRLKRIRGTPATTRDGTAVDLHANIELPQDIEQVRESGATGVGLFRSEFLFLNRGDLPGEDEQFEAYRHVAQAMRGMPVTIRTLDLGADKTVNSAARGGPNPALGLRAIRLCLAEPQMFLTQLRAILRASAYGKIRLLIPMLAHAHEIAQALAMVEQAKQFLDEQKLPYDRGIDVGGMIEVPAAALALGVFVRKLDFLSIGTNDLIQYTLAIDRTDDSVSHLYNPLHPAVLHLVARTIKSGARMQIPVAVCGEMAGDVTLTRLLLGFGLRQFSMHPANLLAVKQQVLKSDLGDLPRFAKGILRADDPEKAKRLLDKLNA
jgi:phosphoenolpyruvate-protein phosphotransferase (PTS system enzyme I)